MVPSYFASVGRIEDGTKVFERQQAGVGEAFAYIEALDQQSWAACRQVWERPRRPGSQNRQPGQGSGPAIR
jgi:hypothetical protein